MTVRLPLDCERAWRQRVAAQPPADRCHEIPCRAGPRPATGERRRARVPSPRSKHSGEEKCLNAAFPIRILRTRDRRRRSAGWRLWAGRRRGQWTSLPCCWRPRRACSSSRMRYFCNPDRTRRRSSPIQSRCRRQAIYPSPRRRPFRRAGGRRHRAAGRRCRRNDPIADLIGPSPRIAAVQRALSEYGYGQIKPTGMLDDATSAAIEKFEREHKLPVTGRDIRSPGQRSCRHGRPSARIGRHCRSRTDSAFRNTRFP